MHKRIRLSGYFRAYRGLVAVLSSLAILSLACSLSPQAAPTATLPPGSTPVCLKPGCLAPDFTLKTTAGETITLYQMRGHPVLVNFWATWCGPCKAEMPDLQKVYDIYQGAGLVVLGINEGETQAEVSAFAQTSHLSFLMLLDTDSRVGNDYEIRAIPASFFVNSDGVIREVHVGSMEQTEIQGIVGAQFVPEANAAQAAPAVATVPPASTPENSLTATPAVGVRVELEGCVTVVGLNVRDRPSREGAVVDWLRNGKCYPFDGRTVDGGWLRLSAGVSPAGGRLWAAAQYITLNGDVSRLPEVK
jgi:peroxiredoxin